MNRPIFVVTIGYIIGIIMGLYFRKSIALLYTILLAIIATYKLINKKSKKKKAKFKIFSISRYFRYIRLIFNSKNLITIILFSIISNSIVILKDQRYTQLYKNIEDVEIIGIITSDRITKDYKNEYKINVLQLIGSNRYGNTNLYLKTDKKIKLEYGNKVKIKGKYIEPQTIRNYGGFNYKEYLKQLEIYGTIIANSVEVLKEKEIDEISLQINKVRTKIKNTAKKYLNEETYSIFLGVILGDTTYIEEESEEEFRNSNMSHILAVSGMHISIIIMGCCKLLSKILGIRKTKIVTIIILIVYVIITGFSPSIFRASIMGIMILIGDLIHRKADTLNSISLSIIIILMYNPYLIENIGLQFSYIATLGIIFLNKNLSKILEKKIKKTKVREIISISLSTQLFIMPFSLFHFNTFSIYFIISNILLSLIICPTIIICFIFLLLAIFDLQILKFFSIFVNIPIYLITLIAKLSFLPFSKIYIRTPKIYEIAMYYSIVILLNIIYTIKKKKNLIMSEMRVKYTLEVIKFRFRGIKQKVKVVILVIVFIATSLFGLIPQNLRIYFVDVGQGDCCFIETPSNKTILIDGGGSENNSYDIGKKTLIPYILDRGYSKIDYILISHFDSDHVGGILTVMKELNVGQVIISKQREISENYKKFKEIVHEKNIKVIVVNKGNKIEIEDGLYLDILWPNNSKLIGEKALNNNSIVCKLNYKDFSMLFTGDIEEIAENQILEEYKDNLKIFKSTILKVAHHGSKTSSTENFIKAVKPRATFIGVGKDNKFGHPSDEVIKRLENIRS